jgi:hypothetical protein
VEIRTSLSDHLSDGIEFKRGKGGGGSIVGGIVDGSFPDAKSFLDGIVDVENLNSGYDTFFEEKLDDILPSTLEL